MNHAIQQYIIEGVAARPHHRARSTATFSVAQPGEAGTHGLLRQHASLHVVQVDLPLLGQLTGQRALTAADCTLYEAMARGARVQPTLFPTLISALMIKKPARSPLTSSDPPGQPVRLHVVSVVAYADVAYLHGGYPMLRRRPVITAPACETAVTQHVQLVTQE